MSRGGQEVWRAPAIAFKAPGSQINEAYFYHVTAIATLDEIGKLTELQQDSLSRRRQPRD